MARYITVLAALLSITSAQLLSLKQLNSIPPANVTIVPAGGGNTTDISSSSKRSLFPGDECPANPVGYGPRANPDTYDAFRADTSMINTANSASTPAGWFNTFTNLKAAVSTSGYLGYKTYSSYDTDTCASDCSAIDGCLSFNIFYERGPVIAPQDCAQDPPSTTYIKCSFWGAPISAATATNDGQWNRQFHIAITGSNGYQIITPSYSVPGYTGVFTNNATINAPSDCNSYITYNSHDGAYDPNLCASDCLAQSQESNPFQGLRCHFFASYLILKNDQTQAQICALYSRTWDASYAVNTGYFYGSDVYTIQYGFSYTNSADPGTLTCPQGSSS